MTWGHYLVLYLVCLIPPAAGWMAGLLAYWIVRGLR